MFSTVRRMLGYDRAWGFILLAHREHDGVEASRNWHRQDNYALNLVLAGSGEMRPSDGGARALRPGVAYQRIPGGDARLQWTGGAVAEIFAVIDTRTFERLDAFGLFPRTPVFDAADGPALRRRFEACAVELESTPNRRTRACERGVLASVTRFFAEALDLLEPDVATRSGERYVQQACIHFEMHPEDRTPLPEYARQLGVSYSLFRKRFAQDIGVSPTEFRVAARMKAAQRLLLDHDVQTTAAKLGYPDAFGFSAQFKERIGQSPTAFRYR